MKKKVPTNLEPSEPTQRDWLDDALEAAREARFLGQRAQQGGLAAWMIARLRQLHGGQAFQQVPLSLYLTQLARAAGIESLEPLLAWYGIPELSEIRIDCADKIARVCRLIGLPWEDLLAHVAVTLNQGEPIPILNWDPTANEGAHAAEVVDELSQSWDPETLRRFREIKARMALEYED